MTSILWLTYMVISLLIGGWMYFQLKRQVSEGIAIASPFISAVITMIFWPLIFTVLIWQMRKGEPNGKS